MDHSVSPEEAIRRLTEGNRRFADDRMTHPHLGGGRRTELLEGQQPFAVVLTCSDSRVPPELLFDCGLGDIFVVRVAGNIIDEAALGSIQYAVCHLACPLVVVLGHDKCGAVTAALASGGSAHSEPLSLRRQLETIRHNIPSSLAATLGGSERLDAAINENMATVAHRLIRDHALAPAAESGRIRIVTARYVLETGEVVWGAPRQ